MQVVSLSTTIITDQIAAVRNFYHQHFAAEATFDCGWYVGLQFPGGAHLCLMEPQNGAPCCQGGIMLNIEVPKADDVHQQLAAAGLACVMPLEDHPWGDRGFATVDPIGTVVYCYHPIPPAPEFATAFKG